MSDKNRKRKWESRKTIESQTVTIPALTAAQKRKRKRLEADPEAWIWEMCGPRSGILEPLTYKFTSQQSDMIGAYCETLQFGGDELVLASRGEGKTTYFRAMVWKTIADGMVDFVALIGATGDDATYSRETIQDMIARSKPFYKLYPEIAAPVRKVGSAPQAAGTMRATGKRFDTGERFEEEPISFTWSQRGLWFPDVPGSPSARAMMQFRGADKPIRGLNILGRRPRIVAIDDLDNPDTVGNVDVANKVIDRVDLDIGGLKGQGHSFGRIMLATLPKQACGVAHHYATAGHPFVVKRFRYLIEKPLRWDMWMEYVKRRQRGKAQGDKYSRDAHHYYLANKREMDAGHKVSNEHRFNSTKLPDGSKTQVSALQNYFDEWADNGEFYCRCELDNELIETETQIVSKLEAGHVANCEGEQSRQIVDQTTGIVTNGIDVRKIELHYSIVSGSDDRFHRIPDYDVKSHGSTETTVEMAESLIRKGLHRLADKLEKEPLIDPNGTVRRIDLTLVDKGWKGNWREDGAIKTWASQPVETFCMERGLRRWLPAKGAPNYQSPKPGPDVIIGDRWHMNRGEGAERSCTEVIWDAEHWHALVEELFVIEDEKQRFEIFAATDGVHTGHRRLAEHIREGADDLADRRRRASRTRKSKFRRDHWWDSLAMALVAKSIEQWFRENLKPRRPKPARGRAVRQRETSEEIGAR